MSSPPVSAQLPGALIVTMTSPAGESTVTGTVTVAASVSPIGALVQSVQFKLDGANLGAEDTSEPYSVPWNTFPVSNGTHTLMAVARDLSGLSYASNTITVTVFNDHTPPTVAIVAPVAAAAVRSTVTISAIAADNVGVTGVQFKIDGANAGVEDTAAPYSTTWDTTGATAGAHTLTAVARDAVGNVTTSAAVVVTVDNVAPTVAVTSPAAGAIVRGATTVSANASDAGGVAGVQFKIDGVNAGAEDTTAPYSASWDTTAASAGSHTLTAVARDAAGNVTTSAVVVVTVDNVAPTVAVTSPAAGATLRGAAIVSADASDAGGIAGVQFRLDGVNLGAEDTTAPFSAPWDTATATDGSHTLTAVARDAAGNVTTSPAVAITVDNLGPTVAVTSPAAGATLRGAVTISANAADGGGIAGVQFKLDGINLGAEDTTAPFSAPWDTATATDGSHTLSAVARDITGNMTTSASVAVTVDNLVPTIALTSPMSGATVSGTTAVSANASDGGGIAGVQFKLDGVDLGAEDTAAPYTVDWNTAAATDGSHTLSAVARDTAGNVATASSITVTVLNATETVVRVEDTSASIGYAGSWVLNNTAKPWSGGTAALANGGLSATGEPTRATLTFTGTGVRWIGFQGPQTGIAKVYLDGTLVATVDTYLASEVVGAVLYTASGLASGTHTLAIECTGTRNPASSDIFVVVDAFDVTSTSAGDSTAPSVSITAPTAGASVAGVITVTASASDNVGVAGVQFKLDGAHLGAEDTTAPYAVDWDTTSSTEGSHTLTVVARDAAGNSTTSGSIAVNVSNSAPPPGSVATRFENTDPAIVYTPGSVIGAAPNWWHGSRSRGWSAETASFNRSDGATARFTFSGTSVTWIGFRAHWAGIGKVYVDGAFFGEIDMYGPGEQPQSRIFTASALAPGTHTIVVESTGRKNPSATDNVVVVDAFDVGPATPPTVLGTRIEESSPTVTFGSGWAPASQATAWSGGGAAASSTTGARATLTFTGTTVTLVGFRGPATGILRVYLDGSFHSTVDTYSATDIQAPIFTDTNLLPGTHEMIIEVSGLKNAASSDFTVVIDAFDVRSRVEDSDAAIGYTGTWVTDLNDAWSGTSANYGSGSTARSAVAGSRATFTFTGTSVTWIGTRGPDRGIARVYLDGVLAAELDTYATPKQLYAPLYSAQGLSPGSHTLAIEATGLKNPASTNTFVFVDAFDVTLSSASPVRRLQQTDATYSGGWQSSTTNLLYTGGTMAFATAAGSTAQFTFTGTSVRWIGERLFDGGIARVYLDGVAVADIDTYAAIQEEFQAAMFTASGLAPGSHTIRIELTGGKNPASTGTRVVVDAFDITP
jgi:hypothetical protein